MNYKKGKKYDIYVLTDKMSCRFNVSSHNQSGFHVITFSIFL
jgi:hypothetical protein